MPDPRPSSSAPSWAVAASSAIDDPPVRAADDAGVAVAQLEVVDARLERLGGELEELPANLARRLDDGPPVVERRLAARSCRRRTDPCRCPGR